MAVKVANYADNKDSKWHNPKPWYDCAIRRAPEGIPGEVAAHRVLNKGEKCAYIANYRGSRVQPYIWQVCMSAAAFANCDSFVNAWMGVNVDERMGESFFLDLFEVFMVAGQFMLERNMIHNDIKSGNILTDLVLPTDNDAV
jgi:hypothetical protein